MDTNFNNGLESFSFHEGDSSKTVVNNINSSFKTFSANRVIGTVPKTEDVAKFYLEKTMESQETSLQSFNKPETNNSKLDFKPFQVEEIPFTDSRTVKFRQTINDISIYGSVVNVEVDKDLNLVSINSSLVPDIEINTIARVGPEDALKKASEYIQNEIPTSVTPLLYIYFFEEKWRLVYLIKNVVSKREEEDAQAGEYKKLKHSHSYLNYVNVIIDAQDGTVLKLSPRAMSFKSQASGDDDKEYEISYRENNGAVELVDEAYNVYTYDLNFQDYNLNGSLPGSIITKQPVGWLAPGVNAHYNACAVAAFLKDILKRNGIDNRGMKLISTVRCVEQTGQNDWNNAAWLPGLNQMVYGQTNASGKLRSLAVALDVVAHEILHGVTEFTSNLDYENQSGALNESYSDIFGTIISNFKADRKDWSWELGEDISGVPFRDLSNPPQYNQPGHMDQYQNLPNNYWGDWGGVHVNSGIHNKAAYNLITFKGPTGAYVFSVNETAVLFYMGLIQLSNSSGFRDSFRSILNAANSLYKNDPAKQFKSDAIKNAFGAVGIG